MLSSPTYRQTLEILHREHERSMCSRLQRGFPRSPAALVRDAVADAFVDALGPHDSFLAAWQRGGASELLWLLRLVAWRRMRGYWRRSKSDYSATSEIFTEPHHHLTPETIYHDREILARVVQLIDEAAVRFGGSRSDVLRSALYARLGGDSDTDVARAHRVPREYVNRAKRWIAAELGGAAFL